MCSDVSVEFVRSFSSVDEALGWSLHHRQAFRAEWVETWDGIDEVVYLPDGHSLRYDAVLEEWVLWAEWDSGAVPDAESGAFRIVEEEACSEVDGGDTRPSGQAAW